MFFAIFIKFFFLMTPFFVVSMFLSMTKGAKLEDKRKLSINVTIAIIIACAVIFFFGKYIFQILGITLDAFRIGTGALLFLTAVSLINGSKVGSKTPESDEDDISQLAVVPLAIPITIGPATIGTLLVMSGAISDFSEMAITFAALILAVCILGMMLYFSNIIEKIVGQTGLTIMIKISGIVLSALSAQIIFTGIKNFLEL